MVDISSLPDIGTPAVSNDSLVTYDSSASVGNRITELKFPGDDTKYLNGTGVWVGFPAELGLAVSDESSNLTVGTAKLTFRIPFDMTITEVRASVNTAPTGANIVVDINKWGTTILSTKLSIDAGEKSSETAATPPVISVSSALSDDEITVDIDQIGSSIAGKGLKIWILGTRA